MLPFRQPSITIHKSRPAAAPPAFTMIELLVVAAIIAILISFMLPVLIRARETSRRAYCATNLRAFLQQVRQYNAEFREYPRTKSAYQTLTAGGGVYSAVETASASVFSTYHTVTVAFTCARGYPSVPSSCSIAVTGGSEANSPATNDVTAAMFLLIKMGRMSPKQFVCPSASGYYPDAFEPNRIRSHTGYPDNNKRDSNGAWRSNFTSHQNLSYSMANPYPSETWDPTNPVNAGIQSAQVYGYVYNARMRPDLAFAADLNSGNPILTTLTVNSSSLLIKQGNSLNHNKIGQNVAYADGHVEWCDNPFAGANRDNIYTRALPNPDGSGNSCPDQSSYADPTQAFGQQPPGSCTDSILIPSATSTNFMPS